MRSRLKSLLRRTASSSRHPRRRALALLSIIVLIAALAAGCGGGETVTPVRRPYTVPAAAEWMTPNASYENTRVANSEIDSENVDDLNITWTQPLTGSGPFGAFASTPLISEDGVAYVQDLASNVMAYDLETGEQLWKVEYDAPTLGPNGLAHEDGVLFGVTNGDVFALHADSGARSLEEADPQVRLRGRGGPEPRLHDPAGGPGRRPAPVRGRQGRRWACARVRCEDGRAALVLRHHGRAPGRRHGFGRRLEHAARRRRGQRLLLGRERLLLA